MLDFPNRQPLETIRPNARNCYLPFGNRVITEEAKWETVLVDIGYAPVLALEVINFDAKKLAANSKYSTQSRTFACIEFFLSGYYQGNAWLTKERQIIAASDSQYSSGISDETLPATEALARVMAGGFVPSPYLVSKQPDPQNTNAIIPLVKIAWYAYYIKPMPSVSLRVQFP